MANWRSNFLKQLIGGDTMRDYQHAARLYTDQLFRLSPKNKFLYHVVFDINPLATGVSLNQNEKLELGMIVKRCDLPSYNFNVEQKNQYNYKNYVQTGIQYQPVAVVLHDDMGDVATAFWKSYYQHYIVDTNRIESDYKQATFSNTAKSYRFGLDTGTSQRFFNSISIFQLSRGLFTEYKMMNPIVNDWSNGSMDQTDGVGVNEHSFSFSYSGVKMRNGEVGVDPQGFASFHYDNTPSPNATGGDSIFGVLGGISNTVSLLSRGNLLGAGLSALTTYEKIKSGSAVRGAKEEIIGVVKDAVKAGANNLGATSKPGVSFPKDLRKQNQNILIKKSNVEKANNNNEQITLSAKQVGFYFDNNVEAKTKFAKYYNFRKDANIEINSVETEWNKLTTKEKNSYVDSATSYAKDLINNKVINYTVDKKLFDQVLSAPIQELTTTVNQNTNSNDQGTVVSSVTGSGGYSY
jgi:hypothetical protein